MKGRACAEPISCSGSRGRRSIPTGHRGARGTGRSLRRHTSSDSPAIANRRSPRGSVPDDSELYEGELVTAVKRFQSRHGLEPDGRIDTTTLEQLNTPLRARVRQLELALERWRRRPYDPASPAIVLNLPEFRLRTLQRTAITPLTLCLTLGVHFSFVCCHPSKDR